jgi:hypothetical protein
VIARVEGDRLTLRTGSVSLILARDGAAGTPSDGATTLAPHESP